MKEKIYLSSGKFAELCGTTKETLRHYHKKEILIPEKQEKNGYFYYTINQCLIFELIKLLSDTGNNLEEIKNYLKDYGTENFSFLMRKSYKNLLEKKNKIEQMMRMIKNSENCIFEGKNKPMEIIIKKYEKEYFWVFPIKKILYEDLKSFSQAVYEFRKYNKENGVVCENFNTYFIQTENFSEENNYIDRIAVKTEPWQKYNYIKEEGNYAVIYYKGKPENIKKAYKKLNIFLKENDLKIKGTAYQSEIISNQITKNSEDYITKISVKIENDIKLNGF